VPEPVFDERDRVNQPTRVELPAELRGVTDPGRIAEYYQRREAQLRDQLRQQPPSPPPPPSRVTITEPTQPNPNAATFSVDEANAARQTLIAAARSTAMQNKPYWERLKDKIEQLMGTMQPADQVNSNVWETAYQTLVGQNLNMLQEQDRQMAADAARIAAERSAPPSGAPVAPVPLDSKVTSKVLPGLGISEEQYRTAQDNMNTGKWPLTADNVGGKRVLIGGQ